MPKNLSRNASSPSPSWSSIRGSRSDRSMRRTVPTVPSSRSTSASSPRLVAGVVVAVMGSPPRTPFRAPAGPSRVLVPGSRGRRPPARFESGDREAEPLLLPATPITPGTDPAITRAMRRSWGRAGHSSRTTPSSTVATHSTPAARRSSSTSASITPSCRARTAITSLRLTMPTTRSCSTTGRLLTWVSVRKLDRPCHVVVRGHRQGEGASSRPSPGAGRVRRSGSWGSRWPAGRAEPGHAGRPPR
jgi:hypothetical protein